jgi:hypothetical protein
MSAIIYYPVVAVARYYTSDVTVASNFTLRTELDSYRHLCYTYESMRDATSFSLACGSLAVLTYPELRALSQRIPKSLRIDRYGQVDINCIRIELYQECVLKTFAQRVLVV